MTIQHFQAFTDEIFDALDRRDITPGQAKFIARMVARVCYKFNRGFKADKFYTACGLGN